MSCPTHAIALWQQARQRVETGRLDEAIACCQQAIALSPRLAVVHALLARLYRLRGLAQSARYHVHEACRVAAGAPWQDIVQVSSELLASGEPHLAREVLACIDLHDAASGDGFATIARQYIALGDEGSAHYFTERAEAVAGRSRPLRLPVHT